MSNVKMMNIWFIIRYVLLLVLIILAVKDDVTSRKIPNRITMPFMIIGLILNGMVNFPNGVMNGLLGLIIGMCIFMVPYTMKAMGAGDLKLMAAIGSLTDWRSILYIALFSALAGGIIVLIDKLRVKESGKLLVRTGKLLLFYLFSLISLIVPLPSLYAKKEKYRVEHSDQKEDYIPYALAIASGTVLTVIFSAAGLIRGLPI